MKRIPFLGPSAVARSTNFNDQRTVNWYQEPTNTAKSAIAYLPVQTAKSPIALFPFFGVVKVATVGQGPHRGALEHNGDMYVVSGKEVYKVTTQEVITLVGTLNTSTGFVGMASNGLNLVIVDGTNGWVWDGTTLAVITDADFVAAQQVKFLDGYFVINDPGTGRFYISTQYPATAQLINGTGWNALDFATAEVDPDNLIALTTLHRELWLMGDYTGEIYYNSGNATFPFDRVAGGFIDWGIAAQWSLANADNTVFWLTKNREGQGQIVRAVGFNAEVISHRGLENAIAGYPVISDAFAYAFQYLGQAFYVITFPSGDATWAYHINTQSWIELKGYAVGRHIANTHCFFNRKHYVGDYNSGNLYYYDKDTYTNNGEIIERIRTTQHTSESGSYIFWHRIQIDMEHGVGLTSGQGSDPQAILRWSDDGGHTWGNPLTGSFGKIGEYKVRLFFKKLGKSRDRIFELVITDPVKAVIIDAFADISVGS